MTVETIQLKEIAVRGRMAYALACLESLADHLSYTSPKFKEMLDLLWSFTDTNSFLTWNQCVFSTKKWGHFIDYGIWLGTDGRGGGRLSGSDLFGDAPEAVVGMMGLCALIGEVHLYGAFNSTDSDDYLRKVVEILTDQGLKPPALDRFLENKLVEHKDGFGFPAPRSFYMDSNETRNPTGHRDAE